MSPYVIFSCNICALSTTDELFKEEYCYPEERKLEAHDYLDTFESLFPSKNKAMDLSTQNHENGNIIEQHLDHVVLFLLQADKTKTVDTKEFSKETHEHKPSGRIILDLRKDKQLILIEKKSGFLKPNIAIENLSLAFNKLLYPKGLQFTYKQYKIKNEGFWEMVDLIKQITKATINRVQFDFIKSKESTEIDPMYIATSILPIEDADYGSIILEADGCKDLAVKRRQKDIEHMILLCSKQGYNLTVHFREFGLYRYGMDVDAQLGIDEKILTDFIEGQKHFDMDLQYQPVSIHTWLDQCFEIITKNGEETNGIPAPKKRKKIS